MAGHWKCNDAVIWTEFNDKQGLVCSMDKWHKTLNVINVIMQHI